MQSGQFAMEYLAVLGITLLLIVPIAVIVYTYSSVSNEQIAQQQALQIARKLVDTAEAVYYFGAPTKTTLKLQFPSYIKNATILQNTVLFVMETARGDSDVFAETKINLSGSLPQSSGLYEIRVEALENGVNISVVD